MGRAQMSVLEETKALGTPIPRSTHAPLLPTSLLWMGPPHGLGRILIEHDLNCPAAARTSSWQ